jgi:hypothetical protein
VSDRRSYLVDLLRSAGGLLLAIGAVVLLTRKSSSDFARTLVLAPPAIALYMMSVLTPPAGEADAERPWRAVLAAASVLLMPAAMLQLLHLLGADAGADLWLAAVFAATALLAALAARRTLAPYLSLLAALSAVAAWMFTWEEILHPSAGTARWLLIVAAALLLATAFALTRARARGAREVAAVGGLAAVLPGVIGVLVSYSATLAGGLLVDVRPSGVRSPLGRARDLSGMETFGWDLYLLIVSILLVSIGARVRSRGLGYAGGLGIFTFIVSVGTQITRLEAGRSPQAGIGGWPIALIAIGVAALLLPVALRREG